jgi:integrase
MTHLIPSLSARQLADIFDISDATVLSLAKRNQIPCSYSSDTSGRKRPRFNLDAVASWLQSHPAFPLAGSSPLVRVKEAFKLRFPDAIAELKILDSEFSRKKRGKGFSLMKVHSKKFGFLYYVRYILNGSVVPSKWCTHTNNRDKAALFALSNRERLLPAYFQKKNAAMPYLKQNMFALLELYYAKDSAFLRECKARGRTLSEKTRSVYYHFVTNVFIPFLREKKIKTFDALTPPLMVDLQNRLLLDKGNKPVTVNRYFSALNSMFSHFLMKGCVDENVLSKVKPLKEVGSVARGCHEIERLRGVFNAAWEDETSYMLCLMIYATGMRNGEIARIRLKDVVEKGGEYFINVCKSKTRNGLRLVPLHGFVYGKLNGYIQENNIQADDYIFSKKGYNQSAVYKNANGTLGARLGVGGGELESEGITYYSGRHYWKTLMNAEKLGEDAEEYFMGHKVSREVRKRYNHKDKQGEEKIIEAARKIFAILDTRLF